MQIHKMELITIKQNVLHEKNIPIQCIPSVKLNECIKNLNNGVMDNKFVAWENFKNMLMVTNSEGLNKINTRIYKIEKIKEY